MRWTRWTAAILLLTYLPGCATYAVVADPGATLLASAPTGETFRVTLRTGEQFEVRSPRVEGDSLRGLTRQDSTRSVAMTEVAAVEAKGVSTPRTLGLLVVTAVVAWAVLLTLAVFAGN